MLTGSFPYAYTNDPFYMALMKNDFTEFWGLHEKCNNRLLASHEAKCFVNRCLVPNPSRRATMEELSKHVWLEGRLALDLLSTHPVVIQHNDRHQMFDMQPTVSCGSPQKRKPRNSAQQEGKRKHKRLRTA